MARPRAYPGGRSGTLATVQVLVTGITGFIGSQLTPRLLADGHDVRGFARSPDKVAPDVPVVPGDAITGEGLDEALDGVDVAYFLMHAMEGSSGGFSHDEREAADAFVEAGRRAGVRRVVYLGGLPPSTDGEDPSRHLQSRLEVERILLEGFPEAAAFRASIVVGAGSRSFDFLVELVDQLPVLALPAWRENCTSPIDLRDVLTYLARAATSDAIDGPKVFEIGGADKLSYGDVVTRIAELRGREVPSVRLPVSATAVTSRAAAALTSEDTGLIRPLMESLEHDLVPNDAEARATFGIEPKGFDEAVKHALHEEHGDRDEADADDHGA